MTPAQTRRFYCVAVMIFMGFLMVWSFQWVKSIPFEVINTAHSVLIGCVFAPVAGIFKFAFDSLDGKIDAKV